jgi:hypothetical protein
MLENNWANGSETGGTGRRRSTFYVTLSENMASNNGSNNSENKESQEKKSNAKQSPSRRLSSSSQTLTLMEPEKSYVSRRTSASKPSSQVVALKSPSKSSQVSAKVGTKPSPVHAPQPVKACTRTVQGPQLLKLAPPQSPKSPKKSSSLLQLSSTKPPESSPPEKIGSRPLQLSLSLRRTPSTKATVVVTSRDSPKSSVRNVSVPAKTTSTVSSKASSTDRSKKIPLVVVDRHDGVKDVQTADRQQQEEQQKLTRNANKDDDDDTGVHSGKSFVTREVCGVRLLTSKCPVYTTDVRMLFVTWKGC